MKVPKGYAQYILTEKKSKFISNIWFIESEQEAREHIKSTKKQYYDARHNVYAYIVDGIERYSDDGEPQATAGMPMLEVLRFEGISNVLAVTTRYFGGTLLGTGGLVRAYSHSLKECIDICGITTMAIFEHINIKIDYHFHNILLNLLAGYKLFPYNTEFSELVSLDIYVLENIKDKILDELIEKTNNNIIIKIINKEKRPLF